MKKSIQYKNTSLVYHVHGTGSPVILLHGFAETNIIWQSVKESIHFKKASLQQYYYAMIGRTDKIHVLRNSRVPVLFVLSTEDVAAPLNDVLRQVYQPEIAYIHIIKNTGHMSMLEAPDQLNMILKNFVNETE